MATLVLGALGTLVGGPIGGAIGALVGQQADAEIFGTGKREGPRLKELAVTTSSYGTPIAWHHGQVRAAGTIIWATDLVENTETSGGGKGAPKTTSYNYSSSFAVALSSRPIAGIGRIWADGNLLRGSAGDLKTGGELRIYTGEGDQAADPLMRSAEGENCPAFRGIAYAVFEDLQLGDFGNRIPALTFEVLAEKPISLRSVIPGHIAASSSASPWEGLTGLSYEGGSLASLLETVGQLYPNRAGFSGDTFELKQAGAAPLNAQILPAPAAWDAAEFGQRDGKALDRQGTVEQPLTGVRYYDVDRDYQPGVQRVPASPVQGTEDIVQFPGSLFAAEAAMLLARATLRQKRSRETLRWRIVELTDSLFPGKIVHAPGFTGSWEISSWEWLEKGVELELRRTPPSISLSPIGDAGAAGLPPDWLPSETFLSAFELPWDGIGSPDSSTTFIAASSTSPSWRGAALYADNGTGLQPLGTTGRAQSAMGSLASALPPSSSLMLEKTASLDVTTLSNEHEFAPASLAGLANGENRLLIGNEIVQFMDAKQISEKVWTVSGLLRGRGGTEQFAQAGHGAGTSVTAIGGQLVGFDYAAFPATGTAAVAAIGQADPEPVIAPIINRGIGSRPLTPVHPRGIWLANGSLQLCWTRRARGGWSWLDNIDQPLIEETERYRIGVGDPDTPGVWETTDPELTLGIDDLAGLGGQTLWVKQIGNRAQSDALQLLTLA